jgi:hypothetical protein
MSALCQKQTIARAAGNSRDSNAIDRARSLGSGLAAFPFLSLSPIFNPSVREPCLAQAFSNALKLSEEHSVIGPPVAVF